MHAAPDEAAFLREALRIGVEDDVLLRHYRAHDPEALVAAACRNMLDPLVAHRLLSISALGDMDRTRWQALHDAQQARVDATNWHLEMAVSQLAARHVPVVLLKDGGLSLQAYPCRYCRKAIDVDLLVPEGALEVVEDVMQALGFALDVEDYYDRPPKYLREVNGQMEFVREDYSPAMRFEFHVRPHAGSWIRHSQEGSSAALFARAVWLPLGDTMVGVLSPEDNLVHVAVHAAKHYFVLDRAMRMYVDIDRLVRSHPIDWDLFISDVRERHVRQAVALSLSLAAEHLGTPIPPAVIHSLGNFLRTRKILRPIVDRLGLFERSDNQDKLGGLGRRAFYLLVNDSLTDALAASASAVFPSREKIRLRYDNPDARLTPLYARHLVQFLLTRKL